jgi:hypothetical protein
MILQDLKDRHKGEPVWVCGSGPSMDWVTPQFFDDKVVVSINDVGFWFGIADFYSASNYSKANPITAKRINENPDCIFVTPDMDLEASDMTATHVGSGNHITFRPHAPFWRPDIGWPTDPDVLVIGGTSAHIAMHLACYMGASQINLVGVDNGSIGGISNFGKYGDSKAINPEGWSQWFPIVVNKLRELYGVRFFRLQPSLELLVVE